MNETLNTDRLSLALQIKRGRRSLRAVAGETGISFPTLSRIENGNMPDAVTFIRLCAWLRIPMSKFVMRPDAKRKRQGK